MTSTTPQPPPGAFPQQPQQPPQPATIQPTRSPNPFLHNVALGVTPLALIGLFLPPRRLELRAFMLGGVVLWGTNQLASDYTGRSFAERTTGRMASLAGADLPSERAKEISARIRAEREARERRLLRGGTGEVAMSETDRRFLADQEKRRRDAERKDMGTLERLWMGDADKDWKEKRDQREKEALQEGGVGYWGLIADQVSEVWNSTMGKKSTKEEGTKGGEESDASKKP
ncbi:hypothetical protein F5Y15DRAFT_332699 [Xylariaceae sp. FL0016]|nr:hypothetical protein F5Y15DRAFT_332699 [Xylariaceae sp. FL0016]